MRCVDQLPAPIDMALVEQGARCLRRIGAPVDEVVEHFTALFTAAAYAALADDVPSSLPGPDASR
jgi:hypothetical protein